MYLKYIAVVIAGYLLGSLNIGVILSKSAFSDDVRGHGSGNPGATNMARVFGLLPGILTLAGDMLKTIAAILIGNWLCGEGGMAAAGIACVLGHCRPAYYGFHGGKGVASGAAVALMISPWVFLIVVVLFLIVAICSKKVSLGSVCAASALPVVTGVMGLSGNMFILAFFVGLMIVYRHKPNIKRLLNRTEPNFTLGKSKGTN